MTTFNVENKNERGKLYLPETGGNLVMSTFSERLRYARTHCHEWIPNREKGFSQTELAIELDITRAAVTQAERRPQAIMRPETMKIAAKVLQVSLGWLATSEGPHPKSGQSIEQEDENSADLGQVLTNNRLDKVSYINALTAQILSNTRDGLSSAGIYKKLVHACHSLR